MSTSGRKVERRRIDALAKFLLGRFEAMDAELRLALGEIQALPIGLVTPPGWAVASARLAWKTGFSKLEELENRPQGPALGDLWEVIGILRQCNALVKRPKAKILRDEMELPVLRKLRNAAIRKIPKEALKAAARIERKFSTGGLPLPPEQLQEQAARMKNGIEDHISADGQCRGHRTMTAQICFLIWLFWPRIETRFSAPEIQEWLLNEFGLRPSDKLVESILTSLRREARRRR